MKLATQILLGFLIAISIDLMDSFVNYRLTLQVKKNLEFLDRSETVIRESNALNERILQMQASFRGFLLTGDETYLERYSGGKTAVPGMMAAERSLVPLAGERAILDSVASLYGQWILNSDTLIDIKRNSGGIRGDPGQQALLDTRFRQTRQQRYNTRLADLFSALETSEYEQRNNRRAVLAAATSRTDAYSFF